jgi:RNA polymerase sigma-70 factor, ECF subfamily
VSEPSIDEGASFDDFVASEFTAILGLALALLHDRDDALDVAQETMTRAFDRWDTVSTMDRPGAWARRVALNLVTDTQRRRTRRARLHLRLRAEPPAVNPDEPDPWDRRFWLAVAALPRRQRDAVALHYVEDLPVAEIATVLEVAEGTVKSDLSRARDRLRAAIDRSES